MFCGGCTDMMSMASSSGERKVYAVSSAGLVVQFSVRVTVSPDTDATTATWVPTTTVRPTKDASNVRPTCWRVFVP